MGQSIFLGDYLSPNFLRKMINESEIRNLIGIELAENELFLVDIHVASGNKIKVEIDSFSGASVQDCIKISRIIESGLDREKEDFELEVSTPGLSATLKVPQQFQKIIGKMVEIVFNNGEKQKGAILRSDSIEIEIETKRKIKPEGKKKKIEITENKIFLLTDIKAIKQQISFK